MQYQFGTGNMAGSITYQRDLMNQRVTQSKLSGLTSPPQIDVVAYSYDPSGNLTKTVDTEGGTGSPVATQCFVHDGLTQLKEAWSATDGCATNPAVTSSNAKVGGPQPYWTSWTYDDDGNRRTQVEHPVPATLTLGQKNTVTTTYSLGSPGHRNAYASAKVDTKTSSGTTTSVTRAYGYDANGSMTSRGTASGTQGISYDAWNRISTITAGATTLRYQYDADGNQLIRQDGTATTLFLGGQEITFNSASNTTSVVRYYTHNGAVVAVRKGLGNPIYLSADLHGTNQVSVSSSTWAISRRYLDPYGRGLPNATQVGTWPDSHGFLNKPLSATTGLTDLGARKYDTTLGRFISVDPMFAAGDPSQHNGYQYAGNNPVNRADPSGLMATESKEARGASCDEACRASMEAWLNPPPPEDKPWYDKAIGIAGDVMSAPLEAASATANFVVDHKAAIAGIATSFAVGASCTIGSGGWGAAGCILLAGAAGSAVETALSDGDHSPAGFAKSMATGAVVNVASAGLVPCI